MFIIGFYGKLQEMAIMSILKALPLAFLLHLTIASSIFEQSSKYLEPQLSNGAQVYIPGSEGYVNATTRWSATIKPGLDIVVRVACEKDVQNVVSKTFAI